LAIARKRTSRYWLFLILSLFLAGFLLLPSVAFYAGKAVAGPYEGPFGVFGFLAHIYGDMARGNWAALALLATPAIIFVAWAAALRLRRYLRQTSERADA
jgi:hypothetical protein